ncbi:hypothetical protein B0H19DRAFT_1165314 [Mycena capillaripes]|nr:hypothetical protein B0H19DRAFT_1165314 [Mycena capillaripes]
MIEITYNGNTAQAQVVDECPGCPWGALDFSRGLFDHFASEDKGVIYGSWVFADESGKSTTQQTTKPPSTHTKQTSTSIKTLTPTLTSTQRTTTSDVAQGAPRASAAATAGLGTEGLEQLNAALGSVLELIVIAAVSP